MTDILSQFPHQELTLVTATNDRPDYASLVLLRQECYSNALAIPSTRGRGTDGHLEVVTSAAKYLSITGQARTLPVNPGPDPTPILRPNTRENPHSAQEFAENRRTHARDILAFRTYTTVESLIKRQLLQAIPSTFVHELMDLELGYSQVSSLDILNHVYLTYGTVTADDLSKNMENLSRQWDPAQQLEDLWAQISKCQTFSKDFDPITDKTVVRITITNLEKSGVFTQALHEWRQRPDTEHTITNMKSSFNQANRDRLRTLNSSTAGFAGKASTNKENTPPPQQPRLTAPKSGASDSHPITTHYCWSHGLIFGSRRGLHNSQTCRTRAPGHREDATLTNMLGGNNTIARKASQPAVFVTPTYSSSQE